MGVGADLAGKTCLVTGASAGIGLAAARELARLGARVVMAVRNPEKGERARRAVMGATGRDVELAVVDVASRASIRAFARDLAVRHPRLDVLVNNAGIWSERRRLSPDGIELVWATNVLGYFEVTELLLPLLQAAGRGRVVNVASQLAGELDLSDVQFERRPWSGRSAYAQSKQAGRMLTWALARRLSGTGVTANAMHPGFVASSFGHNNGRCLSGVLMLARPIMRTPAEGADTAVYLVSSDEVRGVTGRYFANRRALRTSGRSYDEALQHALWERTAQLVGLDSD